MCTRQLRNVCHSRTRARSARDESVVEQACEGAEYRGARHADVVREGAARGKSLAGSDGPTQDRASQRLVDLLMKRGVAMRVERELHGNRIRYPVAPCHDILSEMASSSASGLVLARAGAPFIL
jgi:hypothetical protein